MAEGLALALITDAVRGLVSSLLEVKACVKHNDASVKEIEEFAEQLNKNVMRVRESLPPTVSGDAIDSLIGKLKGASEFIQSHERRGYFKSVWAAKEIKEQIGLLRKDLDAAFQMALLLTNLEVGLDAGRKTKDFQHKMLRIFECHASDTAQAKEDLQKTLGLLVMQIQPMHRKLQSVVTMVENLNQTTETEKFFADVLASISCVSTSREARSSSHDQNIHEVFCDPITYEVMFDPVKATDGFTYNRWTIVDQHLTESPFNRKKNKAFIILCDDISLRRHVFDRVPAAESQFRERRQSYRAKALELTDEGYDADALVMVENVLSWDDDDEQCLMARELLLGRKLERSDGFQPSLKTRLLNPSLTPGTSRRNASRREISHGEEEAADFRRTLDYLEKLAQGSLEGSVTETAMAILTLSKDFEDVKTLGATPGALEKLVSLITRDGVSTTILEGLITSFENITKVEENLLRFASQPDSYKILLDSLADKKRPRIQYWAARTVADLIAVEDILAWTDSTYSFDVIRSLGALFFADVEEGIKKEAFRALENMLIKNVPVNLLLHPDISEYLVGMLIEIKSDSILTRLYAVLDNLFAQNEDNRIAIREVPRVTENILQVFARSSSVRVQTAALRTLATGIIECHDLMAAISEKLPFEIRMEGIRAFGLRYGLVRERLVRSPRDLTTKVLDMLRTEDHFEALVVLIIVTSVYGGALCVAASPHLVKTLVELLVSKFGVEAAVVLGNLSYHVKVDLSIREISHFIKVSDLCYVLTTEGCDDRLQGFWCYVIYNAAKWYRNKKVLSSKRVYESVQFLTSWGSEEVKAMAKKAKSQLSLLPFW